MDLSYFNHRDNQLISKIFNRKIIVELASLNTSPTLLSIVKELGLDKNILNDIGFASFFENSFNYLQSNYRNEYVYKNTIANKIVRGKHKLANTCYTTEFKVGKSIADVAVFNGTSSVYEIKTEYDTFDRLESQITDYSRVFDKVYIVVPESKKEKALNVAPPHVGIYSLTSRNCLSLERESLSNIPYLEPESMLHCLRPSEYLKFVKQKFNYSPVKSPSQTKRDCIELFSQLDKDEAHKEFVNILKNRQLLDYEKANIKTSEITNISDSQHKAQ